MNFLAHALLSAPEKHHIAGGVIGEFYRGSIDTDLPTGFADGIRLHRHIDSFSNRLGEMKPSIHRLGPTLRRPAPVLLDIIADYLLAKHFDEFSNVSLRDFADTTYRAIDGFREFVPDRGRRFLDYLVDDDVLFRYSDYRVARRGLLHVMRRLGFDDEMATLDSIVQSRESEFLDDFRSYFPALRHYADTELNRDAEGP